MALHAPLYEAERFRSIYRTLIESLPEAAKIYVVCEADAASVVRAWGLHASAEARLQLIEAPAGVRLTPWARDPMIAARALDGRIVLLAGAALERRDDFAAPDLLAPYSLAEIRRTDAPLEGGDLLFGDDVTLVGADTVDRVGGLSKIRSALDGPCGQLIVVEARQESPGKTEAQATIAGEAWTEVTRYFEKPGSRQPIFHIDMFVSLTGRRRGDREIVLVGDPRLAAEVLGRPLAPGANAAAFDDVADSLRGQGLHVMRNPLPYYYMDDLQERRRTWIYAPTNNVLLQSGGANGDVVWMPTFGHDNWPEFEAIDAANAALWRGFGYEVRPIPDGQLMAENLGGLHCLANVIARQTVRG